MSGRTRQNGQNGRSRHQWAALSRTYPSYFVALGRARAAWCSSVGATPVHCAHFVYSLHYRPLLLRRGFTLRLTRVAQPPASHSGTGFRQVPRNPRADLASSGSAEASSTRTRNERFVSEKRGHPDRYAAGPRIDDPTSACSWSAATEKFYEHSRGNFRNDRNPAQVLHRNTGSSSAQRNPCVPPVGLPRAPD